MKQSRREFLGSMAAAGAWSGEWLRADPLLVGPGVPDLREVRRRALLDALEHSFANGRLRVSNRESQNGFGAILRPEAEFAGLAAFEFADRAGPMGGDPRLRDQAVAAIESVSAEFKPAGIVGHGDMNSAYFSLVPMTLALLELKGSVGEAWHARMVERCGRLFRDAATHLDRTHDYLNPRGLEAVSALGLHRLTGEPGYLARCTECLDELITRQYPSGAQPYHTGAWVWGRRPAQVYQFLTGSLMLYLGRALDRQDAVAYVRRLADYSLLATNRRGEAFVTTFEGLHKSRTTEAAGWQWPLLVALGDERFHGLARAAYEVWMPGALDFGVDASRGSNVPAPKTDYLRPLNYAAYFGVREVPPAEPFVPPRGLHPLPDISTVFVHEPKLDVSMSLLGGYSALAEADCGDVKLFAMTPELSAEPTFSNAGIDARRFDWKVPSEQLECTGSNGTTRLRARVYTNFEMPASEQVYRPAGLDKSQVYNRLLEVAITYSDAEMLLEYETIRNEQRGPIPSRLLFLLIARPSTAAPRLEVGDELDVVTPPADSDATYRAEARVGPVRFSAPNGSALEIIPEESLAEKITAERPPEGWVQDRDTRRVMVKQANEGSLRLAFEGPRVLDRGRYRIRFRPA